MRLNIKALAFLAIILLLWEIVFQFGIFNRALFPGPSKILEAALEWLFSGALINDVFTSLWRVAIGLGIGTAFGTLLGLIIGRILFLEETIAPFLHILRALPPVALIPLIIIWFGIGDIAKIFSISFAVFFPVWISAMVGAKAVHADYIKAARIFSKSSIETFQKVIFPAIVPFLISGIRIGIGMAFIMVFVSELAGASSGLGYFIATAQIIYRADMMLAGLIVLGLIAAATDFAFMIFAKRTFSWAEL